MSASEIPVLTWKRGIACLGVLAGLALAPAPAQAQVCGDLEDIPEDLIDVYLDEFVDFFPLDSQTCESLAQAFDKACNAALKDGVKCASRQIDALPKAAKPVCQNSKNPSSCNQFYKEEASDDKASVAQEGDDSSVGCSNFAAVLFNDCQSTTH